MGKRGKQGAKLRAKKRADAVGLEIVAQVAEDVDLQTVALTKKSNEDLFVIDTVGNDGSFKNKKKRILSEEEKRKNKKHRVSEKDERQIKKLLACHGKEGVVGLNDKHQARLNQKKKARRMIGTAKTTFDLWDQVDAPHNNNQTPQTVLKLSGSASAGGIAPSYITTVSKQSLRKDVQQPAAISNKVRKSRNAAKKTARSTLAVEVAQPGQSYLPDIEQHQDTIGEALNIELRRNEILDYNKTPISNNGLSEETLKIMVGSSDEDSDDDDDDDDDAMDTATTVRKKKEKMTRAQRNKQSRVREEQRQLSARKKRKKFLNSLAEARSLEKKIKKQDTANQNKRETIKTLKEEERAKPLGINVFSNRSNADPLYVPALPVALTEDIQKDSALRTVKPKGSLLTDRVQSMMARNMIYGKTKAKKAAILGKRRKMKSGKHREYILT